MHSLNVVCKEAYPGGVKVKKSLYILLNLPKYLAQYFFLLQKHSCVKLFFYLILTLSERPNIVRVRKGQGRLVYNLSPHAINLSDIIYRQTIATHDTGSRRKKFEEKNTENMQGNW